MYKFDVDRLITRFEEVYEFDIKEVLEVFEDGIAVYLPSCVISQTIMVMALYHAPFFPASVFL